MQKEQLRRKYKDIRSSIVQRNEKEKGLKDKLLALTCGFESVFCYVSMGSEVSTHEYIRGLFDCGTVVGVPYVNGLVMECRRLIGFNSLKTDRSGNLTDAVLGEPLVCSVVVVPLLAYNRQCFRLGYGGGYYDRYLAGFKDKPASIGLAFDEQLCDDLIAEPFDVSLSAILTPMGMIGQIGDKQ